MRRQALKPHRLSIEAFGPYAEAVEVSFDRLSPEGVFLIHGTTGSGKTFLLDALCFALYGEVSGERNVRALRSDHAPATAVPRVTLEFSAGGHRYRVERSPAHTARKTRGEGTTEKVAQAALFRQGAAADEPIASRTTEVSREVRDLVGLDADQFRQVILLPQGRFAEVLRAKAEEREALLKTLFDTVIYEQAATWLDERARAARLRSEEQLRGLKVLRAQAAREWHPFAGPPADGENHAHQEPSRQEPTEQEPADQDAMERLLERITALEALADREVAATTLRLGERRESRNRLDRLAERWERRRLAAERLKELEAKQPTVQAYRQRLAQAEQAEILRASLEAESNARAELQRVEASITQQLRATDRARDAATALPVSVVLLGLTSLPPLEVLGDARVQLAARRAELTELLRKSEEAHQASARASAAGRKAQAAEARRSASAAERLSQQELRRVNEVALQKARSCADRLDGLERLAAESAAQVRALEAIAPARLAETGAIAQLTEAEARLHQASATTQRLRQLQLDGMAARMAEGLHRDEPCPVCGSTTHPRPATPSEQAVGDQEITAAEQELQAATAAVREAAVARTAAAAALQAALEHCGGDDPNPERLRDAARQAADQLESARAQAAAVPRLENERAALEERIEALEGAVRGAAEEAVLQAQSAEGDRRRAEALLQAVNRELDGAGDPASALQTFVPLEDALRTLAAGAEAGSRAGSLLEQTSAGLAAALEASPFNDAAAVREALQEGTTRRLWSERIQAYDNDVSELRGQISSEDLADLPEDRPDTETARSAESAAEARRTDALNHHTRASRALEELSRLVSEHRTGAGRLAELRTTAQQLSAMADRCQGRSAPYISLQRWVLSAYLGEICRFANQRLDLMTSGRYQLRLTDLGGRGGRKAGLALRVFDAHTGEEREVNSLSGGETFQASLALALGVADTVQSHSGGVQLEALFIDEGFGTLDPDNLQLAMDELDRLREGGRMIGIISHVGALRERIRFGIEVIGGERGSTLRVGPLAPS